MVPHVNIPNETSVHRVDAELQEKDIQTSIPQHNPDECPSFLLLPWRTLGADFASQDSAIGGKLGDTHAYSTVDMVFLLYLASYIPTATVCFCHFGLVGNQNPIKGNGIVVVQSFGTRLTTEEDAEYFKIE